MVQIHASTLMPDYGYQWWISPDGYYAAVGYKVSSSTFCPSREWS